MSKHICVGQISFGSVRGMGLAFSFSFFAKCLNAMLRGFFFFNQVSLSSFSFNLILYFDKEFYLINKTTGVVLLHQ